MRVRVSRASLAVTPPLVRPFVCAQTALEAAVMAVGSPSFTEGNVRGGSAFASAPAAAPAKKAWLGGGAANTPPAPEAPAAAPDVCAGASLADGGAEMSLLHHQRLGRALADEAHTGLTMWTLSGRRGIAHASSRKASALPCAAKSVILALMWFLSISTFVAAVVILVADTSVSSSPVASLVTSETPNLL